MRQSFPFLVLFPILLIGCGDAAAPAQTDSHTSLTEDAMLDISLQLESPAFTLRTPWNVATRVHNRGSSALSLPQPGMLSPVSYRLYRESDGAVAAEVSMRDYEAARSMGGELPPSQEIELGPGGELTYREDLASYLANPIPPGTYRLEATLLAAGHIRNAPPVSVTVTGIQAVAVSQALDARRERIDTLLLHRQQEGTAVLFGFGPDLGTIAPVFRQLNESSSDPVSGIALAEEAEPLGGARWVAWLQAGTLHGGLVRPYDVKFPFAALEIPLQRPRLLPRGFQFADGSAVFVLLGISSGHPTLAVVRVEPGNPPAVSSIPLDGMKLGLVHLTWSGPDRNLMLLWEEVSGSGHQLRTVSLGTPDAPQAGEVQILRTTPDRLVALRVPPVSDPTTNRIEWLEIPTDEPPRVHTLEGAAPVDIPPADGFSWSEVRTWLPPHGDIGLSGALVVQTADQNWILRDASWTPLRLAFGRSAHATLFALDDGSLRLAVCLPDGTGPTTQFVP